MASEWIPVEERLPDIGVSVLCSSPEPPGEDMVWIGQREQHDWYFPGANEMGTPTHWMPLPEPPEVRYTLSVVPLALQGKHPAPLR